MASNSPGEGNTLVNRASGADPLAPTILSEQDRHSPASVVPVRTLLIHRSSQPVRPVMAPQRQPDTEEAHSRSDRQASLHTLRQGVRTLVHTPPGRPLLDEGGAQRGDDGEGHPG